LSHDLIVVIDDLDLSYDLTHVVDDIEKMEPCLDASQRVLSNF